MREHIILWYDLKTEILWVTKHEIILSFKNNYNKSYDLKVFLGYFTSQDVIIIYRV